MVRGEATGTPTGEFWGAKSTGKGFKTMAIDVFTVRNGKLASAYHVENWMTALQQISGLEAVVLGPANMYTGGSGDSRQKMLMGERG